MYGFHTFPDKEATCNETFRVLKKDGIFKDCFYVEKANEHTDKMIRRFYIKSGFFTPPFETVESPQKRLSAIYCEVTVRNVESISVHKVTAMTACSKRIVQERVVDGKQQKEVEFVFEQFKEYRTSFIK